MCISTAIIISIDNTPYYELVQAECEEVEKDDNSRCQWTSNSGGSIKDGLPAPSKKLYGHHYNLEEDSLVYLRATRALSDGLTPETSNSSKASKTANSSYPGFIVILVNQ